MVRVVVIAPVRLYCEGIALGLASRAGCEIVGCAFDAEPAEHAVRSSAPSVVIVDGTLSGATTLVRTLTCGEAGRPAIVALLARPTADEVVEWVSAGIAGLLAREASLEDLAHAVHAAPRGEFPCSPSFVALLAEGLRRVAGAGAKHTREGLVTGCAIDASERLTRREQEVLGLVRAGMSNKEIARRLFIDVSTVKNHVHSVLRKTGLERREQAGRLVAG